jgi:hypothetical protein
MEAKTLVELLDVETQKSHFTIAISSLGADGPFTARYWNTRSRFTNYPLFTVSGSVSHIDRDSVVARALAEIELQEGPVLEVVATPVRPRHERNAVHP